MLRAAVQAVTERDVLVLDAGFEIRQLREAGATRYVVRAAKNVTGRRATRPADPGRGRPGWRGELIRPLARTYRDRTPAATPPDHAPENLAIVRHLALNLLRRDPTRRTGLKRARFKAALNDAYLRSILNGLRA